MGWQDDVQSRLHHRSRSHTVVVRQADVQLRSRVLRGECRAAVVVQVDQLGLHRLRAQGHGVLVRQADVELRPGLLRGLGRVAVVGLADVQLRLSVPRGPDRVAVVWRADVQLQLHGLRWKDRAAVVRQVIPRQEPQATAGDQLLVDPGKAEERQRGDSTHRRCGLGVEYKVRKECPCSGVD